MRMSGGSPEFIGGVYAWVVTATEPLLTISGYTVGGTITAGITLGRTRSRSSAAVTARWYTVYRPAAAPSIPDDCPNPTCRRPASRTLPAGEVVATGWLDGAWTLSSAGPFTIGAVTDARCPLPASPAPTSSSTGSGPRCASPTRSWPPQPTRTAATNAAGPNRADPRPDQPAHPYQRTARHHIGGGPLRPIHHDRREPPCTPSTDGSMTGTACTCTPTDPNGSRYRPPPSTPPPTRPASSPPST